MSSRSPRLCLSGVSGRQIPISMAPRAIMFGFFWLAFLASYASAQLRVGNLTNVLPQCEDACDAYDVMTTGCNDVGVFDITYIYCECTPTNFEIIENCFDCQSVNATQEQLMQALLDDIVNTCNEKVTAPGSTVSISAQQIVPQPSSSPNNSNDARSRTIPLRCSSIVVALLAFVSALLFC
ncbi:hypothetical protein MSAN_01339400 [Mycena sanguinolenta]|uniref:Uncharacterized protein n=1 Tax=Mycena sanguinolenta TaxID=230812 RepID=A0A8H6YED5_9AGAR|nr:hypothetical protein MSAN_01339400 [Mycena sanguinolenta]